MKQREVFSLQLQKGNERMNITIQVGRLTRDPEVRYGGANNTAIAKFSMAVDRRFKKDGQPEADFHNVVAFGKLGEFVEKYLKKGTKIVLSGEVQNNNYTDKNGNKVYGYQIIANNIEFAESKKYSEELTTKPQEPSQGFMQVDESNDLEIPFK